MDRGAYIMRNIINYICLIEGMEIAEKDKCEIDYDVIRLYFEEVE